MPRNLLVIVFLFVLLDFNMPDTFYSWFLITELHVWMLMVRFMAEGAYGKVVRNNIVDAMWTDVMVRVNKLGVSNLI